MFEYACLMNGLLVLIGKPGMLEHLHPTDREHASFNLMKLFEFFDDLFREESVNDWLTWLMLDQFSYSNKEVDHDQIRNDLRIKD